MKKIMKHQIYQILLERPLTGGFIFEFLGSAVLDLPVTL